MKRLQQFGFVELHIDSLRSTFQVSSLVMKDDLVAAYRKNEIVRQLCALKTFPAFNELFGEHLADGKELWE